MNNPFHDRSTPIILRARDMRPEAYAEQHIEAIDLILSTGTVLDTDEFRELEREREGVREALALYVDPEKDPIREDELVDGLNWASEAAYERIASNTPEGWTYGSDEDDPSYGGFYPIPEFYGSCGVAECTDCLPRFDADNNEIPEES